MAEEIYQKRIMYKYSIGHLLPKDKILLFYALKGRNGKAGILSRLNIQRFGLCALLVPADVEKEFDEFLRKWNCPFSKTTTMVGS